MLLQTLYHFFFLSGSFLLPVKSPCEITTAFRGLTFLLCCSTSCLRLAAKRSRTSFFPWRFYSLLQSYPARTSGYFGSRAETRAEKSGCSRMLPSTPAFLRLSLVLSLSYFLDFHDSHRLLELLECLMIF